MDAFLRQKQKSKGTKGGGAIMNNYNIYLEIASVCFLLLMICIINTKRQLSIFQNWLYSGALYALLFLNVSDMAAVFVSDRVRAGTTGLFGFCYGITILSFFLQIFSLQMIYSYLTVVLEGKKIKKPKFVFFTLLSVTYSVLVLTTPFSKIVFYYDRTGAFRYGKFSCILYCMPAVFAVYSLLSLHFHKKVLSKLERNLMLFFNATMVLLVLSMTYLPCFSLMYFWLSVAVMGIFLTMQSPDRYLDNTTLAFNEDGLMVMINDRIEREKPFSVLFMAIHDFEGIKDGFVTENKKKVYRKICSDLRYRNLKRKERPKIDVFRDNDNIYIMFHEAVKAEELAMRIGSKVTDGIYVDENAKSVKVVAKMLLFDFPGRIRTEEQFYSVIRYFLTDDYYNRYNQMQFINEEFYRKKKRYEDVRRLVEEAIRTDGIQMYYQPIYSTQRQDFHSAEALVRLSDTTTIGFVSPEEFIPIAEKEHLILQLEELILRKICSFIQSANLRELGVSYMEINLSGNQCVQADLAEQLQKLINEYDIPPEFINFEVTETATIDNGDCLIRNMQELQSQGSTFALDDYGSGASNLKYLVEYPFEIVKLDKSIVWTHFGATNAKTKAVLPLSVHMLREMKVYIVAEGVENAEQKEELERMGVQYLQGYYFSKPICEEEYIRFLKKYNCKQG